MVSQSGKHTSLEEIDHLLEFSGLKRSKLDESRASLESIIDKIH